MMDLKRQAAFTLIELMVVISLAMLVLTIGVPSFQELIKNNRLTAQVNEFIGSLHFARSQAIDRGLYVTVCKSSSGTGCASSNHWDQGWIVFTDINGNGIAETGTGTCASGEDCILRVVAGAGGSMTLRGSTNVADRVTFNAGGLSLQFNGTFNLCDDRGVGKARFLNINAGGQARFRSQQVDDTCPS